MRRLFSDAPISSGFRLVDLAVGPHRTLSLRSLASGGGQEPPPPPPPGPGNDPDAPPPMQEPPGPIPIPSDPGPPPMQLGLWRERRLDRTTS